MCNLYSQTKSQDAMRHVFDDMVEGDEGFEDLTGNLPPMAGIYPDYAAPIIRHGPQGGWQLTMALLRATPELVVDIRADLFSNSVSSISSNREDLSSDNTQVQLLTAIFGIFEAMLVDFHEISLRYFRTCWKICFTWIEVFRTTT